MLQTYYPRGNSHTPDVGVNAAQDGWIMNTQLLRGSYSPSPLRSHELPQITARREPASPKRLAGKEQREVNPRDSPSWAVLEIASSGTDTEPEEDELRMDMDDAVTTLTGVPPSFSKSSQTSFAHARRESHSLQASPSIRKPGRGRERTGASQNQGNSNMPTHPARGGAFDGVVVIDAHTSHPSRTDPSHDSIDRGSAPASGPAQKPNESLDLASALTSAFTHNSTVVAEPSKPSRASESLSGQKGVLLAELRETSSATDDATLRERNLVKAAKAGDQLVSRHVLTLDELLETREAPIAILQEYALPHRPPAESMWCQTRFVLHEVKAAGKSKQRSSRRAYTIPRYSKLANFKERLDSRLGPGDLNRGLTRRPRPKDESETSHSLLSDASIPADYGRGVKRTRSIDNETAGSSTEVSEMLAPDDVHQSKRRRFRHESEQPGTE